MPSVGFLIVSAFAQPHQEHGAPLFALAAAGYGEYRDSFPLDGRILNAGITETIEQETETGRLKGQISLNEIIDHSFITSLGKK
jgi:hypothetical protein